VINPFELNIATVPDEPAGRGLGALRGSSEPGLRGLPGDAPPGERPLPGSRRFAGDRIKGLGQLDPTIFAKLFA